MHSKRLFGRSRVKSRPRALFQKIVQQTSKFNKIPPLDVYPEDVCAQSLRDKSLSLSAGAAAASGFSVAPRFRLAPRRIEQRKSGASVKPVVGRRWSDATAFALTRRRWTAAAGGGPTDRSTTRTFGFAAGVGARTRARRDKGGGGLLRVRHGHDHESRTTAAGAGERRGPPSRSLVARLFQCLDARAPTPTPPPYTHTRT
jgi:hypothetical protein